MTADSELRLVDQRESSAFEHHRYQQHVNGGGKLIVFGFEQDVILVALLNAAMGAQWGSDLDVPGITLRIGSAELPPTATATVCLEALDVADPGLESYVIDVSYDPGIVDPVACVPDPDGLILSANCDIDHAPGVVRCDGLHPTDGLTGQVALCDITFQAVGEICQTSELLPGVEELCLTDATCPAVNIEPGSIHVGTICGDVDCDGDVDAVDALFVLQYVVGMRLGGDQCPSPPGALYLPTADVNCDGIVDAVDAMFILQYVVGTRPDLCVCA